MGMGGREGVKETKSQRKGGGGGKGPKFKIKRELGVPNERESFWWLNGRGPV